MAHFINYGFHFLYFLSNYHFSLQIKGKESENSYQKLKRSQKDRHTQTHRNCIEIFRLARLTAVFLNRRRVNVCEHATKTASLESLQKVMRGMDGLESLRKVARGMDGGKLSEINWFYLLDSVLALISDNFPPSIPLATPWWHLS